MTTLQIASISEILQQYSKALNDNEHLKKENETLRDQLKESREKYDRDMKHSIEQISKKESELSEKFAKFEERSKIQTEDLEKLLKENENLREENKKLTEEKKMLSKRLEEMDAKIEVMTLEIRELKERDSPITVREALRVLQDHMSLEIVGSKTKIKKTGLYKLYDIRNDSSTSKDYADFLTRRGIFEQDIRMLSYLIDVGDDSAHFERPPSSYDDLIHLAAEDDDDESDTQSKKRLMDLLRSYCPPDLNNNLSLISPLAQKRKIPQNQINLTFDFKNTNAFQFSLK